MVTIAVAKIPVKSVFDWNTEPIECTHILFRAPASCQIAHVEKENTIRSVFIDDFSRQIFLYLAVSVWINYVVNVLDR